MTRAELKEKAKMRLKDNWGEAIIVVAILGCVSILSGIMVGIIVRNEYTGNTMTSIIGIIINSLLMLGFNSFYLKLSRGEQVTYKELFSKTNMFSVALLSIILMSIFVTLWSLLLVIPGIIAAISYSQVPYILLDNPNMSAMDAIKMSKNMMQGHKADYFVLMLSFIGWSILAALTLGIGYLWLIPYTQVTMANFYDSIKI